MPKPFRWILTHLNELAEQFGRFEPKPGDAYDPDGFRRLLLAAAGRRAADKHVVADAIIAAWITGYSWLRIGRGIGMTSQAARQRYGASSRSVS